MQKLRKLLLAALVAANTGCALRPKDAPWDPPRGQSLHEQLPNWDHKAARVCGAHLPPERRSPGMTDRC